MDLPSQFERLLSRGCSVNLETLSGQDNTHQLKIVGYIVNDQDRSASQLKLIEARRSWSGLQSPIPEGFRWLYQTDN